VRYNGTLQALAWSRPSRLSEITLRPNQKSLAWTRAQSENTNGFLEGSLGWAVLAWASRSRLSEMMRRSKQELSTWARYSSRTRASFYYSRLGETSSLGREW